VPLGAPAFLAVPLRQDALVCLENNDGGLMAGGLIDIARPCGDWYTAKLGVTG